MGDSWYSWDTQSAISRFYLFPERDVETKEISWMIFGGYHVLLHEADYGQSFYEDYRLIGRGNTYEESLINFAHKVWLDDRGLLDKE